LDKAKVTREFERIFQPLGPTAPAPPQHPVWSYPLVVNLPYAPYQGTPLPEPFSVDKQQVGFVDSNGEESDAAYEKSHREGTALNLLPLCHPDFKQGSPEGSLIVHTG
jgi:hypothetical protein